MDLTIWVAGEYNRGLVGLRRRADVTALCKASKSDSTFKELHRNFCESKKHTTEGL